jgi:hypothetical protein
MTVQKFGGRLFCVVFLCHRHLDLKMFQLGKRATIAFFVQALAVPFQLTNSFFYVNNSVPALGIYSRNGFGYYNKCELVVMG